MYKKLREIGIKIQNIVRIKDISLKGEKFVFFKDILKSVSLHDASELVNYIDHRSCTHDMMKVLLLSFKKEKNLNGSIIL